MRVGALYRLSNKESVERQMERNLNPGDDADMDIPGQRIAVRRFLDKKVGWELVKEYVEPAVSAYKRTAASRDILQRAIADARAGLIEVLVVFKSDRLSRRSEEYPGILAELQSCGVAVWTVVEERPIPYKTHTDKLIAYVEGWRNEGESLSISQRSSERKLQKAEDGRWTGGPVPFGYKLETLFDESGQPIFIGRRLQRRLVPARSDADEGLGPAEVIRELFERYVRGAGMPKLTEWMNSLPDVKPARATEWRINMVRNMLTNPLYAGLIRYGVRSDPDRHRANGVAKVLTESKEPALISRELWGEAQRVQARRAELPPRAKMERYALSGVVRCGLCGSLMMGKSSVKRSRKDGSFLHYYYHLRCNRFGAARLCSSTMHRMEVVEALILQELKQLVAPGGMIGMAAEAEESRREAEDRARKQQAQWERRLATVNEALLGLARKRAENEFSRETYETLKAAYERELIELQTNLSAITEAPAGPDYRALAEAAFQLAEQWPRMEVGQKKQLLLLLCEAWGQDIYVLDGPLIEFRSRG